MKGMYLVFSYDDYYPCGGSGDFVGAFDTFEDAVKATKSSYGERYEIYDVALQKWSNAHDGEIIE